MKASSKWKILLGDHWSPKSDVSRYEVFILYPKLKCGKVYLAQEEKVEKKQHSMPSNKDIFWILFGGMPEAKTPMVCT